MKKLKLILSMLMLICFSVGNVWAAEELKATLDFTGQASWNIPTSGTNTTAASFTDGTYTIELSATTNYKLNSGYLILGKKDSYLALPAFSWKTTKILVTGASGASESVKQNIFVGTAAVSTETTGAKGITNTYEIASTAQAAGNVYVLKVTSAHNTQITKIEVYGESEGGATTVATPVILPTETIFSDEVEVSISCATDDATIYYTLDGNDPTTSSLEYTAAFTLTETTTVKAIAVKDGLSNSAIASATFTQMTAVTGYDVDFESDLPAYTDWEFLNLTRDNSMTAHGGSYFAKTNASGTASATTKNKIATPGVVTYQISKIGTNTNANSFWYVEVSEDGTTWTQVGEQNPAAAGITQGTWTEYTADLTGQQDVYVRVYYKGTTAVRAIDDISIAMASAASVAAPGINASADEFLDQLEVTLSCTTEGAKIYYTLDGSEPTVGSTEYTQSIVLNATTTVKAIAAKDGITSTIAEKKFTKVEPLTTMQAIFEAATSTETDVYVLFNDWVVSAVSGSNAYVTDGTKGLIVYTSSHGFEVNDKLNGLVATKLVLYKGSAELKGLKASNLTVTKDGVVTPVAASIADLGGANTGAAILLSNVTFDGTNLVDANSNAIQPYKTLYADMAFENGKTYNVKGIYLQFNETKEILPREAADIEEVTVTPEPLVDGFYLISEADGWNVANLTAGKKFELNSGSEYKLTATLVVGDKIKVVKVANNAGTAWYPDGEGTEYTVDAAHAGENKDIYFQEEYKADWAAFGGYFWTGETETPVEPTAFTLTFNGTGTSGSDANTQIAATVEAVFTADCQKYVASVENTTKVYAGRPIEGDNSSLKFGTTSAKGTLSFTLENPSEMDSIIVNATQYGNNASEVTVNGTAFALNAGNKVPQDCKITPEGTVSTITIEQSTSERMYLRSVILYPKAGTPEPPVGDTYTVAGSSAELFGTAWDETLTANDMTLSEGLYVWEKKDVELTAGDIEFKVVKNHAWDESWPDNNWVLNDVTVDGTYDVKITFNEDTKEISAVATKQAAPKALNATGSWDAWADPVAFTVSDETAVATLTLTADETPYEFKLYDQDNNWYGNAQAFTRENAEYAGIENGDNMTLLADVDGEYTLTWTYATSTLAITYPAKPEPIDPNQMYVWNGVGVTTAEAAVEKGGKAEAVQADGTNIVVGASQKGNWCLKANKGFSSGKYYLGIALDNAVNAGDTIRAAFFRTTENNTYVFGMDFSADKDNVATTYQILTTGDPQVLASNGIPADSTYIVPEGVANAKYIRLYRNSGGTGLWIAKFEIAKKTSDTPEPPVVETEDVSLVPGVWNVDNAKFAAVTWKSGETMEANGVVSEWFVGGDTVKGAIPVAADSIAFARFNPEAAAPSLDMSVIWNHTDKLEIDPTLIYTITGWPESGKDYSPGYWGAAPEYPTYYLKNNWDGASEWTWKETTRDNDGIYHLVDAVFGGGGVNYSTSTEDDSPAWVPVGDFLGDNTIAALDTVDFALNPDAGTITVSNVRKYPDVAEHTYSVVGPLSPAGWDQTSTAGDMTLNEGVYSFKLEDVELATGVDYEYKIVKDHSWDVAYPQSGNATFNVAKSGIYDVTFKLDLEASPEYSVETELIQEIVVLPEVKLAGIGDGWNGELLTPAADNKTASITKTLDAQSYAFKMIVAGNWLGNSEAFTRANNAYEITANGSDMSIEADVAGDYIFTWTYETKTLEITFPDKPETYYLKNNWGTTDWSWKEMTPSTDGTFRLENVVYGGTGVNWNNAQSDDDATFVEYANLKYMDGTKAKVVTAYDTINLVLDVANDTIWAEMVSKDVTRYAVAGNSIALFLQEWSACHQYKYTDMVKQSDGTYEYKVTDAQLPTNNIEFKVCKDCSFDECWPAENWVLNIPESGVYTVTITFNPITKDINAIAEKTGSVVIPASLDIRGTLNNWTPDNFAFDGYNTKALVTLSLAAGSYEFKLVNNVNDWFGNNEEFTRENASHREIEAVGGEDNNMKLEADVAGDYLFTFVFETNQLIVTFPSIVPDEKIAPLSGEFSIAASGAKSGTLNRIRFSRGNLQYNYAEDAWYAAEKQYELLGDLNLRLGDVTYQGSVDLFAWSCESSEYGIIKSYKDADFTGDFVDWGTKFDDKGTWTTLSTTEWKYLLNRKKDSHALWTIASIGQDSIRGLMLFPDEWAEPTDFSLAYGFFDLDNEDALKANWISFSTWDELEQAGAVFLPMAGSRTGYVGNTWDGKKETTSSNPLSQGYCWVDNVGWYGYYWLSTQDSRTDYQHCAEYIIFPGWSEGPTTADDDDLWLAPLVWSREKRRGNSVRLVLKYQQGETPTAVDNTETNEVKAIKMLKDNQIYIIKGGKTYSIIGTLVK